MRIRDRIRGYALEALGAADAGQLEELQTKLTEATDENLRQSGLLEVAAERLGLESLLTLGTDLDAALAGNQAQRFFRSISRGPATQESRDFEETMRQRILRASHMAYALQGNGESIIETHLDFLIGDEIKPTAKKKGQSENKALQDTLDGIWEDPRNALDDDHEDLSRSLLLEGELFQEVDLSPTDGHLETSWLDPIAVIDVLQDPRKRDNFIKVKGPTGQEDRLLFVLNSLTDQIEIIQGDGSITIQETFTDQAGHIQTRQQAVSGLCFADFWNRPKGGRRGRGELTPILDQIDAYDEMIWSTVDVQNIKRLLLLHVKSPQIKLPSEAKKFLAEIGLLTAPRNPRTFATNDKVDINVLKTQTAESEKWLTTELGIGIWGGKGLPEGWRGSQGAQNLAGMRASEFLPLRRLRRKQRNLLRVFRRRIDVELELQRRAGVQIPEGDYELVTLEVGGKDKQRQAEILNAVAKAIVQALSVDAIKPELANKLFVEAAQDLGIEITGAEAGLPSEADIAKKLEATLAQIGSQKGRTDEGNEDEEDRDRADERGAA